MADDAFAATAAPARARFRLPAAVRGLIRFASLIAAVSVVTFALVALSPIDPVKMSVGQATYANMSAEKREQLRVYWDVDTPVAVRYARWAEAAVHGDFGTSLRFNRPVTAVIAERAGVSLLLMTTAWVISGAVGFALGIAAGTLRGSWVDRLIKGYCFLISSTPTFWLGLVALIVFSVWLGWFPLGFSAPIGQAAAAATLADRLHHLALPALVLSLTGIAGVALHTREKVIDVLGSEYVWFAQARGEGRHSVLLRHGLRNLALPAITLHLAQVSEIFGGSILVEQVFSYPGLGQAAVTAGIGGDAPLLVGIALVSAVIVFAGNALADVILGLVDPRVREVGHGAR
ncbi:ABC transporter permease [Collinsella vaginalis]|uniref:ABC transporter permease n=1 Tax=Collinsella vaginalis TaxID=1870987 RepID=UPI000A26E8A6|nr:ABC transporter permease [Collinsella vaginalis]